MVIYQSSLYKKTYLNKKCSHNFVDVIGEVLCCSDMEKLTVKGGKETDKRTMLLEDLELIFINAFF